MTLYNEIEPYAAQWIRNLVGAGHVVAGDVDERSIVELQPGDLQQHVQAHFFAGIGVWSHALRLAGWPDDAPVWTGSCPCQPFSSAGRKRGEADERHLWPEWFRLISQCRPPIVLGEQVASPDGLRWLDAVFADLEGAGYACGASDLCAAGVGAPHIRQRLYFVAIADSERCEGLRVQLRERAARSAVPEARGSGAAGLVGDPRGAGGRRHAGAVSGTEGGSRGQMRREPDEPKPAITDGAPSRRLEDPDLPHEVDGEEPGGGRFVQPASDSTSGFWYPVEWLPCQDGRFRPVEPGTFPLAHGVANRMGKLRAYGNAIVPQVASKFVRSVMGFLAS